MGLNIRRITTARRPSDPELACFIEAESDWDYFLIALSAKLVSTVTSQRRRLG